MSMERLRVGISAVFTPADTPHARTFLRALAIARNTLPALKRCDWIFLDDKADPTCAKTVAHAFINAGVDIVVGHFSSDAALQAAAHYAQAGIPLLTPAATIDELTDGPGLVLRFCPSDRLLAANLIAFVLEQGWQSLCIEADSSSHGQALARTITATAQHSGLRLAPAGTDYDADIFAGRLAASKFRLQRHVDNKSVRPLILTDDAASPYLGTISDTAAPVFVIGFRAIDDTVSDAISHRLQFGTPPETYFSESLLAFQLLASLASSSDRIALIQKLSQSQFELTHGALHFEHGERLDAGHTIWRLDANGLSSFLFSKMS